MGKEGWDCADAIERDYFPGLGGLRLKAGNDCRRWNRMAAKADLRVGGQLMLE